MGQLYEDAMVVLGRQAYSGEPSASNRLLDMFHSGVGVQSEERILKEYPKSKSN